MVNVHDYLIEHQDRDWATLLAPWQWLLPPVYSVWLVNRFADVVLVREDGQVQFLDVGAGLLRPVAENQEDFCRAISEPEKAHQWLLIAFNHRLRREGLVPGKDQCYGFKVFPGLGGGYVVDNVEIRDLALQYAVTGKIFAQLKDVPEGTRVKLCLDGPVKTDKEKPDEKEDS